MKPVSLVFSVLLLIFFCNEILLAQTPFSATYTFGGSSNVVSFNYNGTTHAGIQINAIRKVGIQSSPSTNNFRGRDWPLGASNGSNSFTGIVDSTKYIEFSVTADPGFMFTIGDINFGVGRSGTGPRQWQWRGNHNQFSAPLDNFTTLANDLVNSNGTLTHPDLNDSWNGNVLNIAAFYNNITDSAVFRIYAFNAEASAGTGGIQGTLTFNGTIQPTGGVVIAPEPANHVSNLNAALNNNNIALQWVDPDTSNGQQGADGLLVVGIRDSATTFLPTDGNPIVDDLDWSDSIVFVNVAPTNDTNHYTFNLVPPNANYQFRVFPFTNSGFNIDYKTDAVIPSVSINSATITNCDSSTNLNLTAISYDTASISWSGGSGGIWLLSYGLQGTTAGNGTIITSNQTSTTIYGLQDSTNYVVFVKDSCIGFGSSNWSAPLNFTTLGLPAPSEPLSADSAEVTINFDQTVLGVNEGKYANLGLHPNPIQGQINSNALAVLGLSDGDSQFGDTNESGDFTRGISTGGASTGGMYAFDVGNNNIALGFQATSSDFNPGSIVLRLENKLNAPIEKIRMAYDFLYYNDQGRSSSWDFSFSTDSVNFTSVFSDLTPEAADASPSWQTIPRDSLVNVFLLPGERIFLRWESADMSGSGSRDELAIDNIALTPFALQIPTACDSSTNLTASNIGETSADLNWSAGSGNVWKIAFGPLGSNPDSSANQILVNNNFAALSGLLPATTYEVFVQDSCPFFGTSVWSSSTTFTTLTPPFVPTYNIAQVRTVNSQGLADSTGVECRLRGVVSSINYGANFTSFFIQDATGGINVYSPNFPFDGYVAGFRDSLEVQGVIGQFRGMQQIEVSRITRIAGNQVLPAAAVVNFPEEANEGSLIKLEGARLVNAADWPSTPVDKIVPIITANGDTIDCFISTFSNIGGSIVPAPAGFFDLTGVSSQRTTVNSPPYIDGYRIMPRFRLDFDESIPQPVYKPNLFINEVSTDNNSYLASNNQPYAWIELFNPGNEDVDLGTLYMSDDFNNRTKFQFASNQSDLIIPANGFKIIWASNETQLGNDHLNFRLSRNGDRIILAGSNGSTIDSLNIPPLGLNQSYGRLSDGGMPFVTFSGFTPNASNSNGNVLSITYLDNGSNLKVFPNPVHQGWLFLSEPRNIQVFTIEGKLVLEERNVQSIATDELCQGLYFLRTDKGEKFKIIVK